MTRDDVAERQRQMAEQAVAAEDARKKNVRIFEAMWLSLGPDVLKLDGTRHDAELMESRGLAMSRWNQLIGMESQAEREEAALATRPEKRPTQPTDDQLPDRTIEKQARDWEEQTKYLHVALAELRKLAAAERKELESFTRGR
jgi:hypothetical protein